MARLQPIVSLAFLVVALPAFGKTYKNTYSVACSDVWSGVTVVLGDADHYNLHEKDDAKMHADYQPKHSVHVDISGTLLQRVNHVTLVPKGTGCEMQVVSNYSGWGHDDQSDFKKRVDEAMLLQKTGAPSAKAAVPNNQENKQAP